MAYLVRKATIQDAAEMIRLERQSPTTTHWTEQQYVDLLAAMPESPTRLALVTREDGSSALAGFLVARHSPPEWELENIVVAPEVRGTGIGKKLMDTLLVQARQTSSDAVLLEVRESNAAARRLYEKLGFRETGRRKAYYANPGEDAVLYSKILV
ncbi:MAG TPA: ribosomal protein S18-alanine N-acetyltransferase [Terriglobales bacterium]|nr:ribosomal protein S18-alanine N-acetyltransferase [Terriglobales bacterium]